MKFLDLCFNYQFPPLEHVIPRSGQASCDNLKHAIQARFSHLHALAEVIEQEDVDHFSKAAIRLLAWEVRDLTEELQILFDEMFKLCANH